MLTGRVTADIDRYDMDEEPWWKGMVHFVTDNSPYYDFAPRQQGVRTEAHRHLSKDESSLSMNRFRFRLSFLPEKDEEYSFEVYKVFVPTLWVDGNWVEGAPVILATNLVEGIGTGDIIYWPSEDGVDIDPPAENGRIYMDFCRGTAGTEQCGRA